ncbi:hypothetical protein SPRG_02716 [Saprolegnia parasitica CBS 223.65]|uniref:Peptidase M16 N-terminal domain-containing protein n=1 Tax=Saprolegnia parasitica (strain CBS 223.65) TaxID=695850 RepID=A0A067CP36_SAPPC|nr:hypothetical protein SPRG_02716 [Saprolegnia parasitica CBS 223.65]KDO32238.1 hypothetical protein SPRG_02716 [Saprolegnia parasitica CBS 223.65]|eukprot:XP_012196696.1 hypothetical protein SPRG_02716 [Saprolegnia parasitica CBS 223.65]
MTSVVDASKSPSDLSAYELFLLPNALEVLLVHAPPTLSAPRSGEDEVSEMAAVCLTVGVGTFADPPPLLGLAHYLEHMLFLGSAKYPQENAFEAYLSRYGGYSNAATDCEMTKFFFEVAPHGLLKALDIFANFFIAPLLLLESMDRELVAIDDEFQSANQHDRVRLQQVLCDAGRRDGSTHPYHQFGWGNSASLKDASNEPINVRVALNDFFKQHYTAGRMKLAVCSSLPLATMAECVRNSFGAIPSSTAPGLWYPPLPRLAPPGRLLTFESISETHALHLFFALPPTTNGRDRQSQLAAAEYLRYVLRHEGSKSLLHYLHQKGWATAIEAGIAETQGYEHGSYGSIFEVQIDLSLLGVAHWDIIVTHVYSILHYCQHTSNCPSWIHAEFQATAKVAFAFPAPVDPISRVQALATYMLDRLDVDRKELLGLHLGPCLYQPFNPAAIATLLTFMVPTNMQVALVTTVHSSDIRRLHDRSPCTEPWGRIAYETARIQPKLLARWTMATPAPYRLPRANPFMPTDFTIEAETSDATPLRLDVPGRHWLQRSTLSPRVTAFFQLVMPFGQASVDTHARLLVYVRLAELRLRETKYFAQCAEMDVNIRVQDGSIHVSVAGYRHHLPYLVTTLFDALTRPEVPRTVELDPVVELLCAELASDVADVGAMATYIRLQLLDASPVQHALDDVLRALRSLTITDVSAFISSPQLFARAHLTSFVAGNASKSTVVTLAHQLVGMLSMPETLSPRSHALYSPKRLQTSTLPVHDGRGLLVRVLSARTDDVNSCVEMYFQCGALHPKELAILNVLRQLMKEPLFHHLRTLESIGYHVACYVKVTHNVLGYAIVVESATSNASAIARRLDAFLQTTFPTILRALSPDALALRLDAIRAIWQRPSVPHEVWAALLTGQNGIDDAAMQAAVRAVTHQDLLAKYDDWFLTSARKLRVHVVGQDHAVPNVPLETLVDASAAPILIQDISRFKQRQPATP